MQYSYKEYVYKIEYDKKLHKCSFKTKNGKGTPYWRQVLWVIDEMKIKEASNWEIRIDEMENAQLEEERHLWKEPQI